MKITYGVDPALNYSQIMYEWTLAGLVTEGILAIEVTESGHCTIKDSTEKKYAASFHYAEKKYAEAMQLIKTPSGQTLKSYAQSEILSKCFDINKVLFPIALQEGLLDLKDIAAGIGAGTTGLAMEKDR